MRHTEVRGPASRRRAALQASVVASALGLVLAVTTLVAPTAVAEKGDDPGIPSQREVDAARSRAEDARSRVAEIQSALVLANQRLDSASIAAEQAYEAYNGAKWKVDQATEALAQARADARRADRQVRQQRNRLALLVSADYQGGGDVSALDAVLGGSGPEGLMSQMLAFEGGSSSLEAEFQQFTATASLAEVFRRKAREARDERLDLLETAEAAKDRATAAAAAAARMAADISAEKGRLMAELAHLQGISVQLAEQRQSALEEIERRRAAREAELEAKRQQQDSPGSSPSGGSDPAPAGPPPPAPPAAPAPAPAPPPSAPPAGPAGGASRAIAFARAQLGEPYVWGAAGPDSWDCSGLTMGAWQAGGVSLPHYSVAQYEQSTPITAAQLRPGDLVFWGTSSSPGSIHHVAMYLGDGMIIHAPRTGRPVEIDSMYYWIPPNFFGRV